MAKLATLTGNQTNLAYAVEETYGNLPVTPIWVPQEPNSYTDTGGTIKVVARQPISASRQKKKGVTVDLDAMAGYETDVTQTNIFELVEGFMFANARDKGTFTDVTFVASGSHANGTGIDAVFSAGQLVFVSGSENNNGLFLVTATATGSLTLSGGTVVDETAADATIKVVGVEAASGDIQVDASLTLPALTSTTLDFTTLGLVAGEWIFVGGDATANKFTNAANNGFKRVRSISANRLVFDKSYADMVTNAGTGKTIRLFFGEVVKNEADPTLQVRKTFTMERALGAPDPDFPSQIQAQYIKGCVANKMTWNVKTADKMTASLEFMASSVELVPSTTGLKSGTRLPLVESDAFNTSSDIKRIGLNIYDGTATPEPLYADVTDFSFTVDNGAEGIKAVGFLGNRDVNVGQYSVSGNVTAYMNDVAAVQAVTDNADATLDVVIVKNNAGIVLDFPLVTLGDAKVQVEQNKPITLPISLDAATGAKIDPNLDHTLLTVWFSYLPDAAEA